MKVIDGKNLICLSYSAKGGGDVLVKMYFVRRRSGT
jgi:hypothetical protein